MSVLKPLARLYNQLNPATLSGAIDIVIVKQPDGSFQCSPFHVRFGKFQVPYASLSMPEVEIKINDKLCRSVKMIVGENGEALFCHEDSVDPNAYDETEDEEELGSQEEDEVSEVEQMEEMSLASSEEEDLSCRKQSQEAISSSASRVAENESSLQTQPHQKPETVPALPQEHLPPNKRRKYRKRRSQSSAKAESSNRPSRHKRSSSSSTLPVIIQSSHTNIAQAWTSTSSGTETISNIPPQHQLKSDEEGIFDMEIEPEHQSLCATPTQKSPTSAFVSVESGSRHSHVQLPGNETLEEDGNIRLLAKVQRFPEEFAPAILENPIDPSILHCASDCEQDIPESPLSTSPLTVTHARLLERPDSPKSDSEIGTSTSNVIENVSWRWGEHLEPYQPETPLSPGSAGNRVGLPAEENRANNQRVRSLSPPSVQDRAKKSETSQKGGIYLENLASVDQTTKQMYLYSKASQKSTASVSENIRTPPRKSRRHSQTSSSSTISPFGTQYSNSDGIPSHMSRPSFAYNQPSYNLDESTSEIGSSMPQSPGFAMEDIATQTHIGSDGEVLHCNIELSLCGGLKNAGSVISKKTFDQYLVTYDEFQNDPFGVLTNPNLVVKMNGSYLKWQVAAPLIISHVVFQRSLDDPARGKLMKNFMGSGSSSSRGWWWSRSKNDATSTPSTSVIQTAPTLNSGNLLVEGGTVAASSNLTSFETAMTDVESSVSPQPGVETSKVEAGTQVPKNAECALAIEPQTTNRLSSNQIARLNLRMGTNDISFRITSQFFGSTTLQANIFVFDHNEKIIISDVDGTVTKSDVMGQILPQIGVTDWSQQHIVDLYQKIADNGFKFLYLSARAISMASMTKTYLRKVRQNEKTLPDGPLLLSPASLVSAFHQEVILKKPEEFKIRCLSDIRSLFPNGQQDNPFYAGFGNKSTDSVSYISVGIPTAKIFIINPKGDVKIENALSIQTSYFDLCSKVDHLFPPQNSRNKFDNIGFSSFHYWRELPPIPSPLSLEASINNEMTLSTSSSSNEKSTQQLKQTQQHKSTKK